MTARYEVVGAVDRSAADGFVAAEGMILVDDGNEDLLIAQPASDDDE